MIIIHILFILFRFLLKWNDGWDFCLTDDECRAGVRRSAFKSYHETLVFASVFRHLIVVDCILLLIHFIGPVEDMPSDD